MKKGDQKVIGLPVSAASFNKIKFVNKKYLTDTHFSVKIPEVMRNGRVFTADAAL